jgi:hypothetical protein
MSAEHDTPAPRIDTGPSGPDATSPPADIARQLTGNLPCVTCRYNLRGLSVKAVCPECGTPVRAAILAAVDPYAALLQRVPWPRLTAAGLLAWSGGALLAALLTWGVRLADVLSTVLDTPVQSQPLARGALLCIAASGAGAVVLIRPHGRIALRGSLAAGAGAVAIFALGWVYAKLHLGFDPVHTRPYLQLGASLVERSQLRLQEGALLLLIVLALRPNARLLAARSLLMRLGRVDRQAMLAMGVAITAGATGDFLQILSAHIGGLGLTVSTLGLFMIVVGAMLLTVGIAGVFVDCLRIADVLLRPPLSPAQAVGPEPAPLKPLGGGP